MRVISYDLKYYYALPGYLKMSFRAHVRSQVQFHEQHIWGTKWAQDNN
jgi:hypothetical protein